MSFWRHTRSIALLPGVVLGIVPGALLLLSGGANVGWGLSGPIRVLPPLLGGGLIIAGLGLLGWTVALFASAGRGTLAPWDPTRQLVVRGVYRHVRNPMISGVATALLGEAALTGSLPVLAWFFVFLLANVLYIPLVEERGLERRFGEEYVRYKRNVPRWLPRVRP